MDQLPTQSATPFPTMAVVPASFLEKILKRLSDLEGVMSLHIRTASEEALLTKTEAAAFVGFCTKTFDKKGFKETLLADGSVRYMKKDLLAPKVVSMRGKSRKRGIDRVKSS